MKPLGPWARLHRLWQPRHVVAPTPAEELLVTSPLQIRHTLGELARLQNPVALQAADGQFMSGGVLAVEGALGVVVSLRQAEAQQAGAGRWPVNVTTSGVRGLVLFTLRPRAPEEAGLLRAAWPEQLIHVQSRRHFRLTALSGRRRRAWLSRPAAADRLPVHDLSEEGVGVEVPANHWPQCSQPGQALLHLDDELLPVPLLEVVHTRAAAKGGLGIVGARMLGLGEEQLRVLRRWIASMQAAQCAGAGHAT